MRGKRGRPGTGRPRSTKGGRVDAAWSIVDAEVRGVVRERGIDPTTRRDEVRAIAESVVAAYEERALVSSVPDLGDPRAVVAALVDAVAGFGPLQRYLDDPEVEEIWIKQRLTAG